MSLSERIGQDLTAAMKAQDAPRISALRMAKAALKNREIDKRAPLDDAEAARVLQGLVKQREDSVQQFRKAGRRSSRRRRGRDRGAPATCPQEASDDEIDAAVERGDHGDGRRLAEGHGQGDEGGAGRARRPAGKPVDGKKVNEAVRKRRPGAAERRCARAVREVGQRFMVGFDGHSAVARRASG